MFFTFSELNLKTAEKTRSFTFQADSPEEAVENALYTAKLSDGRAIIGATGKVVYPAGEFGDTAWVLSQDEPPGNPG